MSTYSREDIVRMVKEQNVQFIRLQISDIFGIVKSVAIPPSQLDKALANECMFDGSSIEGFARIEESDMKLYPDRDTFVVFPWSDGHGGVARLICDVHQTSGEPFEGDPRYVLRRVISEAKQMGFTFNVGPECEFFLFHRDEQGRATTLMHDQGGYFDLDPIAQGDTIRQQIVIALENLGFEIEAAHHECAPGQHEIDFRFDEVLKTADNIQTFKYTVRNIANQKNMHATFMPKPIFGIAGSGMHINMSLCHNGNNAFCDPAQKDGLSRLARSFIAGIMDHIRGMCAITNPLVNSYKRLVPGYEAPCHIAWSARNRSPLIRIPDARGEGTRIELRNPDPSGNPYLSLALCLAAGLDGIRRELTPPPATDVNIYALSPAQREELGIGSLPANLGEAIEAMAEDKFICSVLGTHISQKYLESKRQEWNDYSMNVSPWEIERYLRMY